MRTNVRAILVLTVATATAYAAPQQLTNSAGNTFVDRVGPAGSKFAVLNSTGDLTPGAPGNIDGSHELYALDLATGALVQMTASAGDSSSVRISADRQVVISSRADLVPGVPGNADASFESFLFAPGTAIGTSSLTQLTASAQDTFFQTFWDDGDRAFFVSKGDLTPGQPGNSDGRNEVYSYDVAAKTLTQLTNSPSETLIRAICPNERCGVIESFADLAPGVPGNADGSNEVFLMDLDTLAFEQITASAGSSSFSSIDPTGRYVLLRSRGDLTPGAPGNADGSLEIYVYDRTAKTTKQLTNTAAQSSVRGFVPKTHLVVVESNQDLAPASAKSPGNADGSLEVYTIDFLTGAVVQHTASAFDSSFQGFANAKNGLAAIDSKGNLDRRAGAAEGTKQVFLQVLGGKRKKAKRLTNADLGAEVDRFDVKGRALFIAGQGDVVPGRNTDHSWEVFVAQTKGKPKIRQLVESAKDTFVQAVLDTKTILIQSAADLDPSGPGNADGSFEVFSASFR